MHKATPLPKHSSVGCVFTSYSAEPLFGPQSSRTLHSAPDLLALRLPVSLFFAWDHFPQPEPAHFGSRNKHKLPLCPTCSQKWVSEYSAPLSQLWLGVAGPWPRRRYLDYWRLWQRWSHSLTHSNISRSLSAFVTLTSPKLWQWHFLFWVPQGPPLLLGLLSQGFLLLGPEPLRPPSSSEEWSSSQHSRNL